MCVVAVIFCGVATKSRVAAVIFFGVAVILCVVAAFLCVAAVILCVVAEKSRVAAVIFCDHAAFCCDAAPFFRIFNPILQGEKFDPHGNYVRRHVPELALLPDKWIHKPWQAPSGILRTAGVTLGETYPKPIVDHAQFVEQARSLMEEAA